MTPVEKRYFHILQEVVLSADAVVIETHLADAFELGRSMVEQGIPPDEVAHIHHVASVRLARMHPELSLAGVSDRLGRPLMEMSMAYGLAFREQTERRYREMVNARLEQSHKLEAVGTLAAGIAHDFNNLLGSIVGFAEMAADELPEGAAGKEYIAQILTASFRARDLVGRILAFARQSPATPLVPVDLVAQVRETLTLLNVSYKPDLEIRYQGGIKRAMVMADPGQVQQIVMNLCINAADAMNQRGEVVVRIDHAMLDGSMRAGGKTGVCLTVADSGQGMTPEVQKRIFDPFFTTKSPNKNSGLGLSVVYGIVSQLGGGVEVKSRADGVNRGSEFKVYLPLADSIFAEGNG